MKKILTVLTIVTLVASSAFAAFSGSASLGFGGNFDNGNFGFIDSGANVKFDMDLATADAEAIAEGDVYASIKATFALKVVNGEKGNDAGDLYANLFAGGTPYSVAVIADITEAKIAGENWYVSILGLPSAPNFASSAIDTYTVEGGWDKYGLPREDFDKNANYGLAFNKTTGVEVGVYDYVFGFGLLGDYAKADTWKLKDNLKLAAYAATPEYDFSGVKLQAGAVYSYSGFNDFEDGVASDFEEKNNLGLSAKVGFANDTLSATVATDVGFDLTKDEFKDVVGADVSANFVYDFLTVDAYYATKAVTGETPYEGEDFISVKDPTETTKSYSEQLLSFQVKTDLNSFDVPVALTVGMKDVIAKQNIFAKAEVTVIDGLKLTVNGGYTIDADGRVDGAVVKDKDRELVGKWNAGASVEYTMDELFTAKAGLSMEQKLDDNKDLILGANASISSTSIIPGAELKLAWADAKDLLDKDADKTNYGKITVSAKIEF